MSIKATKFIPLLKKLKKEGHIEPGSQLDKIIYGSSRPEGMGSGVHSSGINVENGKITSHGQMLGEIQESGESKE